MDDWIWKLLLLLHPQGFQHCKIHSGTLFPLTLQILCTGVSLIGFWKFYFMMHRWCGGSIYWYSLAALSLTTITCYTIYAPCTLFSLWWFTETLVYSTNTMRMGLLLPVKSLPASWLLFWCGKFREFLKWFGAHLLASLVGSLDLFLSSFSLVTTDY